MTTVPTPYDYRTPLQLTVSWARYAGSATVAAVILAAPTAATSFTFVSRLPAVIANERQSLERRSEAFPLTFNGRYSVGTVAIGYGRVGGRRFHGRCEIP